MRVIKFSGREIALIRMIDFSTGTTGAELIGQLGWPEEDVIELVAGLAEAGFLEYTPDDAAPATPEAFRAVAVEVNPGFASAIRDAIRRTL
jgi:hypothetical protein